MLAPTPLSSRYLISEEEVRYGVKNEMAVKLTDVVFRRTSIGVKGHPGQDVILKIARIMAEMLNWDQFKTKLEIDLCLAPYKRFTPEISSAPANQRIRRLEAIY